MSHNFNSIEKGFEKPQSPERHIASAYNSHDALSCCEESSCLFFFFSLPSMLL